MQKLYLKRYEVTLCKGFDELYRLVKEHGGELMRDSNWASFKIEPIEVHSQEDTEKIKGVFYFRTYMRFKLGNHLYYVEFNKNPFFDDYYSKEPIDNSNCVYGKYHGSNLKKKYFWYDMSDEEIKQSAKQLFDDLINFKESKCYDGQTETIMVPNTYNNGFHKEEVRFNSRICTKYHVTELVE